MDLQEPLGKKNNNFHTMFKVMFKLSLKHSSPPVILCKMMGSASASSSAKSTICQVLQDSGRHWLTLTSI